MKTIAWLRENGWDSELSTDPGDKKELFDFLKKIGAEVTSKIEAFAKSHLPEHTNDLGCVRVLESAAIIDEIESGDFLPQVTCMGYLPVASFDDELVLLSANTGQIFTLHRSDLYFDEDEDDVADVKIDPEELEDLLEDCSKTFANFKEFDEALLEGWQMDTPYQAIYPEI